MDDETRSYLAGLGRAITVLGEDLRREIAAVRDGMTEHEARTRRHLDVTAEALRADSRAVAEGVAASAEAIERLRTDLRDEMDQRFGVVHLAFADLRRDVADLLARR
jgi:hypothetical protein